MSRAVDRGSASAFGPTNGVNPDTSRSVYSKNGERPEIPLTWTYHLQTVKLTVAPDFC
jgi:hypothetical protein